MNIHWAQVILLDYFCQMHVIYKNDHKQTKKNYSFINLSFST